MRLAYVDESYTSEFYFLGALVLDDACVLSLGRALDDVIQRTASAHPEAKLTQNTELHGYAIFQGKDDWASLRSKVRARIAVYDQSLQAIGDHDVRILLSGIDRRSAPGSTPIHDLALTGLLRRINYFAHTVDEPVLVIADEVSDQDRYRLRLRDSRGHNFVGHPSMQLHNIADTLHFAPSRHSRFIQAIDMITFLHCRRARGADSGNHRAEQTNDLLWSRIAERIHENRIHPQSTKAPR